MSLAQTAFAASVSMPVNGCTSYAPRLLSFFDGCAEFSAVTGRAGCTKVKGICPACVTYEGDHLQMWLPDFLVEVTQAFGRSMFAEASTGVALNAHLKAATAWATSSSGQAPFLSNGVGLNTSHSSFWHVRVLPVPFGSLANTYPPLSTSKGVGLPTCYSAVSELAYGQWTYGLSDMPVAAAIASIAIPVCYTGIGAAVASLGQTGAAVASSMTGVGDEGTASGFPSGCALPVPAKLGLAKNTSPSSDAWNPAKLCIGTLGGLIPRTGLVPADDPFKAALTAGVKFASLTSDHFGDSSTGGWNITDKWQLVYPPSPHGYCFRPGDFNQAWEVPAGVLEDPSTRIADNATGTGGRAQVYVFAVWRKRTSCEEPLNVVSAGAAWQADYQLNKAKNLALCSAAQVIP